jgi:hypothetical protein
MGFEIEVKGAAAVVEAMFRLDKELWRELQKDVRKAGQTISTEAAQNMPARPLRNWGKWIEYSGRDKTLWYEMPAAGRFTSSFRSKSTRGFRQVFTTVGPAKGNAAGAIFLLAGSVTGTKSKHPQGRKRSENFKAALNNRYRTSPGARGNGTWPRVLGPLYYKHRAKVSREIGQAVERATSKFNKG